MVNGLKQGSMVCRIILFLNPEHIASGMASVVDRFLLLRDSKRTFFKITSSKRQRALF